MFNFLSMADNYEERKVDRFEQGDLIVDTCYVNDGAKDYETAVQHPKYNGGDWIIVEAYDTKEEARDGHNRWVKTMTSEKLPTALKDCLNAQVSQLFDLFGGDTEFPAE